MENSWRRHGRSHIDYMERTWQGSLVNIWMINVFYCVFFVEQDYPLWFILHMYMHLSFCIWSKTMVESLKLKSMDHGYIRIYCISNLSLKIYSRNFWRFTDIMYFLLWHNEIGMLLLVFQPQLCYKKTNKPKLRTYYRTFDFLNC